MSRFSGRSCGGRIAALAFLAALLALPASSTHVSGATLRDDISLGFSPSTIAPVSGGVPVYTVGDSIWAMSSFPQSVTVSLMSANATQVLSQKLQPMAITPLYTFGPKDADGKWNFTIISGGLYFPVSFLFVNLKSHLVAIGSPSYTLSGDSLAISAPTSLGDSYDQEVCASSASDRAGVRFAIPASIGAGTVTITPGSQIAVTTSGVVNSTFTFWFELYHPYSYSTQAANLLTLKDIRVAESSPVVISAPGTTNIPVSWAVPPREGRFEVRAFFQNSTVFQVSQSRTLIMSPGSWTSLDSCQANPIGPQGLTYDANLTGAPSHWARQLYLMYRTSGVEGVSSVPISANLSSVHFLASAWQQPLQDMKVSVAPDPRIAQTSVQGSTVYVLAARYPLPLNYSVDVGGIKTGAGSLTLSRPFSAANASFDVAKLDLRLVSSNSSAGALRISGSNGAAVTRLVQVNHNSTFFLPAGSYTVTGAQGADSQTSSVVLVNGEESSVTLDLTTVLRLELILVATGLIAAGANVLIWLFRSRGFRPRLVKPAPAKA